jgi:hypothetical protein
MVNNILALDITKRIQVDYLGKNVDEATTLLTNASVRASIVSGDQLVRCLLFLSKGDMSILRKRCIELEKEDDPRDIILEAEKLSGGTEHYFGIPFDEIEEYERELHAYWDTLIEEEDLKKAVNWESSQNRKLAPDIIQKINSDFSEENVAEVIKILEDEALHISRVGSDQLGRSLIYLCKGNINELKYVYLPMMRSDPRDVIMTAEEKAGHRGHYFGLTFEEIEECEKNTGFNEFSDYEKGVHKYWDDIAKEEEEYFKNVPFGE